jgi:hypothetical protein
MQQTLAAEAGIFGMCRQGKHLPPMGFLYAAHYTHLPCDKWGFGGGLVSVRDIDGYNYHALATYGVFRQHIERGFVFDDISSLGDLLMDAVLFFAPRQLEFDMGASVGWFAEDTPYGSLRLKRGFAPSVDMQVKIIFTVWHLGITVGMGISCLLAKNFEGRDNFSSRLVTKASIGLSYYF